MKKAIIIALSLVLVLALFTSCDEPKHEHTWNDGEVTTAATCTEKGVKTFTCTACKETKTEEIPALGHNLEVVTVDSGYVNKGSKTTTCTRKGCDFCNVEELEVKSLTGNWLKTSIQEGPDVYLAFSGEEGQKNKLFLGSPVPYKTFKDNTECTALVDTTMDFEYSLVFDEEGTKILIVNETEDPNSPYIQTLSITENEEKTEITIKQMNFMGTKCDLAFSIVPAHDFPKSGVYSTWIYNPNDISRHIGGWMCTEEIEDSESRFVWTNIKIGEEEGELHNSDGEGGSCSVCGYKSAK